MVLLRLYPRDIKYVYTKTCTQVFIAALFIIGKMWKQPKCPSTGEWLTKMYISIKWNNIQQ